MAFTVEVVKKNTNEEFDVMSLSLFHQECGGGRVEAKKHSYGYQIQLSCKRCRNSAWINITINGTVALVNTAIDGESRILESGSYNHPQIEVCSVAKSSD